MGPRFQWAYRSVQLPPLLLPIILLILLHLLLLLLLLLLDFILNLEVGFSESVVTLVIVPYSPQRRLLLLLLLPLLLALIPLLKSHLYYC